MEVGMKNMNQKTDGAVSVTKTSISTKLQLCDGNNSRIGTRINFIQGNMHLF